MQFLKLCLFICFVTQVSYAQKKKYDYYDGPYITIQEDSISLKWVEDGQPKDSIVLTSEASTFDREGLPVVDLAALDFDIETETHFDEVKKWVALSDIHGQHDLFVELLQAQGIIDQDQKWSFGEGQLVIIGDIFDRGDKVTDALWFIFDLEKQASAEGGKLHLLLGNHELMIMHADLRFLNPKYLYTQGALRTRYPELFNANTVLGQWLRSKPVCLTINESAFVHGGFSKAVLERTESLGMINKIFKESLYAGEPGEDVTALEELLYFDNGPLWYRGYANPEAFNVAAADSILMLLGRSSIVVGHTSMPEIVSLHDNKVFLVDSSIKFGKSGEVLIYDNGQYQRGLLNGEKQNLEKEASAINSPFAYMQDLGEGIKLVIQTDVKKLLRDKIKEEWQEAKLTTSINQLLHNELDIKVRARGNHRKEVCQIPPLKIDFPKSLFTDPVTDNLKMVLPCSKGDSYQQNLYKEYTVYKLYQEVDTMAVQVQLAQIELRDEKKSKYNLTGYFVEDPESHMSRTGVVNIEAGIVSSGAFDRTQLVRFSLFQYMILNQDWSFLNKHNLEIIKIPGEKNVSVVPYDFDYSGIVNQPYATPTLGLNMTSIRQKHFRCTMVTKEEMQVAKEFYNSRREALLSVIDSSEVLSEKNKGKMKDDILSFYKDLNDESKWKKQFLGK